MGAYSRTRGHRGVQPGAGDTGLSSRSRGHRGVVQPGPGDTGAYSRTWGHRGGQPGPGDTGLCSRTWGHRGGQPGPGDTGAYSRTWGHRGVQPGPGDTGLCSRTGGHRAEQSDTEPALATPSKAGPEPRPGQRGGTRELHRWKRLRKTAMVWPMAKEAGSEQERPEEGGMPEMTSGSWEKQETVRDMGGDSFQAGTDEKQQRCW
ncbi:hypothetical protein DUI87_17452 [Hirundo rustica rustica]|uniref:Uncharacterized protein n=1 Tax=Hirundo rustica rustica TaxID=333673 RepID=A0A3M0KFM4_HIRRU|nr:hypothetical protein DUI87_17452 [Hirundo rustica rustica]